MRVDDVSEWSLTAPGIHGQRVPMRDRSREEVDFCIVGAGAAGGVLGAKLSEAGFSTVLLEAGEHWDPTSDFVSDERAAHKLYWTDERIVGGEHPVELGSNNSGRGVGGSTVHYSMVALRAHPEDFRRRSLDGDVPGADMTDWPLSFDDLEPYYEEVEEALQIAGPTYYPWGRRRRRYPQREHQLNACANVLVRGCMSLGIPVAPCPIATLSAPHGDRPPCVYRGLCNYGCTTNAKSSTLVTFIPRAVAAGAEVRAGCMVAQVTHNRRGLVDGVLYFRRGERETCRQRAKHVVVAGYAIETPRLLLNSASSLYPQGLGNSSGLVGKYFMVQPSDQIYGKFAERINQYKAPPPGGAISEHFNRTMPETDFVCGYVIEVVGPHPIEFATRIYSAQGLWGAALRREMADYNFYSGLGMCGECMPQAKNSVTLHPTERDPYGLPIAHVRFGYHENDKRLIKHAHRTIEQIIQAAGGTGIFASPRTAHLMGTCRMGSDPATSVVNADCRSHDIPNLFVCDGSVFPTATAVNPSVTIEAIAARTADRIGEMASRGELRR